DRTLDDPDVIDVEKNGEVRLRIINAAASTNFTIDLGGIEGSLMSVDGNPVVPLSVKHLPIAVAQRADLVLRMPADGVAGPVFAISAQPLTERPIDNSIPVDLTGSMMGYIWGMSINDQGGLPATIDKGQRVELVMRNRTMMAHPMHLHGHNFQVTEINGKAI